MLAASKSVPPPMLTTALRQRAKVRKKATETSSELAASPQMPRGHVARVFLSTFVQCRALVLVCIGIRSAGVRGMRNWILLPQTAELHARREKSERGCSAPNLVDP